MTATKPMNILFITTDQQRRDTLGCYGNKLIRTPNLDRLASCGATLDRAYCESPICLPSRVTMITGKTAAHHGVTMHNVSMRDDEYTLGDELQNHGYRTHFIGKPHFKSQQHCGTEESIADWRDGKFEGWNGPYAGFETVEIALGHVNPLVGHYGRWLKENHPESIEFFREKHLNRIELKHPLGVFKNRIPEEACSSTYVGERTCAFLKEAAQARQPFYCFASFPDPHWPIMPPEPWFSMYDKTPVPPDTPYNGEAENPSYPDVFRDLREGRRGRYNGGGHYVTDPEDIPKIVRPYWGSVSLIDKQVGKILDELEQLGLAENTLVVFTTDHGEFMGAHGMVHKGSVLWEELIHVPFLMSLPGAIPSGMRSDALFSFTDIVPTLLDFAGIRETGLAVDGVSQKDVLTGSKESVRRTAVVQHAAREVDHPSAPDQYALIHDDWKLVYFAGSDRGLLFNLKEDPRELNNLYSDPAHTPIRDALCKELLDQLVLSQDKAAVLYEHRADIPLGQHILQEKEWGRYFDQAMKGEK